MRSALIIVALFGALPAVAQDATTVAAAPVPEKKICKLITPTGSIMDKRFCLTKSEWRQLDGINAAATDKGLRGRAVSGRLGVGDDN